MSAVSFWSSLDSFDDTQLAETEAERWEFDQRLREEHGTKQQESAETFESELGRPLTRAEVARRIGRRDRRASSIMVRSTVTTVAPTTTTEITHSVIFTNPVSSLSTPLRSGILVAETPVTRARTRSSAVSNTPIASPVDPISRPRPVRTLDTPTHIDSPETTLSQTTIASPTPNSLMPPRKNPKIGSALVPVTAHHALITEAIKEKPKIKAVRAGEGPLSGMKFFFPGVEERVIKAKSARDTARMWYGIILEAGGQVEPEYTPEAGITHLVWDEATSPAGRAKFCSYLGVTSLEELPDTTVVIKTAYISACKKHRSKMAPAPFLSFPPPPRAAGRRLAPLNIAGPSKRSTDITSELKPSRSSARSRRSESQESTDSFPQRHQQVLLSPEEAQILADDLIPTEEPTTPTHHITNATATEHAVQSGPGWTLQSGAQADGLDLMIAGVVKGDALVGIDDDADSDTEPETDPAERAAKRRKLVAEGRQKLRKEATAAGGPYTCMRKNDGEPKDSSDAPNEFIAKKLDELHDTYEAIKGKNSFSVVAYRKAAGVMRRTLIPIRTKAEALELKGIGDNLATRIEEIATNNPFGRAYFEDTAESRIVQVFKGIYGVGAVRARELYKMGARSLDDLKTGQFGLTEGQSIGLELYHELQQRIPRAECQAIFTQVRNLAIALDPKIEIEIMGSYRRGAEDSGDVDMLLTRDTSDGFSHAGILPQLMKLLFDAGIFTHTLSAPSDPMALEAKWMGLARADPLDPTSIHRRVDILCIPFEQRGAALIYFTGNDIFNRSLRLYARKNGYSLNQRGLYKGVIRNRISQQKETEGELVASRTEEEIFNVLGIRWRPPHHRRP